MSSVNKAWRVVKPHVPLIKFRKSGSGVSDGAGARTHELPASSKPPIGMTPRGSGMDESQLPKRYHRKSMTASEMEMIERGGPDIL